MHNFFLYFLPPFIMLRVKRAWPWCRLSITYRLLCPNALLHREGALAKRCLGKAIPLPAVFYACYRGSRAAAASVTSMIALHRAWGTWRTMVDAYIAPYWVQPREIYPGRTTSQSRVREAQFLCSRSHRMVREMVVSLFLLDGLPRRRGIRTRFLVRGQSSTGRCPLRLPATDL